MPTPIYLEDIQPFINFVNGNIGTKLFSTDAFSTWQGGAGRPVVATGVGYGTTLGYFPPSSVLSVNGKVGIVVLTNADVGLGNVQNVDTTNASNITTGMLPLSVIPAAALERLVHVADEVARFALTTAQVQNGDTVMQDDTQIMYRVIDDTHLGDASGYQEYRAGLAAQVHWSGVLDVPQSLVDIGAITGAEKDMLIYSGGQWTAVQPLAARANLDLPVKGDWDMTPISQRADILQYPVLDALVEGIGGLPFPVTSPNDDIHSFQINEGSPPGFAYLAATANTLQVVLSTGSTADLSLPTGADVTAILLEITSDMSGRLQGAGTAIAAAMIIGRSADMSQQFTVIFQVGSNSGTSAGITIAYAGPAGSENIASQVFSIGYPINQRLVVYFDGATRQIGYYINGADQGWAGSPTPFQIPAGIDTVGVYLVGGYANVEAGDPQIGSTVSVHHSIDTGLITEVIPGLVPWYAQTSHDPSPPVGAEVGNRYYAQPGGSYNGVAAETGDIVEFMDATTIFVYPKASSLVRLTRYQADIGALQNSLSSYISATDTHLGTLDSQVSGLQTTTGDHETRITTLESDVALIGIPDLLQRALQKLTKSGRTPEVLWVRLANDLPYTGLAGADAFLIGKNPTGVFASFSPGMIVLPDGNSWTEVAPYEGMVVTTQDAGPGGATTLGHGLRYVPSMYNQSKTGLEVADLPAPWVCTSLDPAAELGSPRWVIDSNFGGAPGLATVPVYVEKNRSVAIEIDSTWNGNPTGVTLHTQGSSSTSGQVMVTNDSPYSFSFSLGLYTPSDYVTTIVNEDSGVTLGPGIVQGTPVGILPAGGAWRIEWFVDAQGQNNGPGVLVLSFRVREIRKGPSQILLSAVGGAATVPINADFVRMGWTGAVTVNLPAAVREGKRIVFQAEGAALVTFAAGVYGVDAALTPLQVYSGDLFEVGFKESSWYLLSKSTRTSPVEVVLKASTTLNNTKVLTLDGTGVIGPYNTVATSPAPAGAPADSTQASHHIVIEGCASGVFYYRESILRTRCYGSTFLAVGETLIAEEWDGLPPGATTSVAIDASQSDGLLRITVGSTGVLGDMSWKAYITTRTNHN